MNEAGAEVIACHLQPLQFDHIAAAMNLNYQACDEEAGKLRATIEGAIQTREPCHIEARCAELSAEQDQQK